MRISEIIKADAVTVSCELFPPKQGAPLDGAISVVRETAALCPSFISITYGAGGNGGAQTISLADEAENGCGITALAHLTCVSHNKSVIRGILNELRSRGITNILALRGDIPDGGAFPRNEHYRYASELMNEIREYGGFCVGGACYPEGHPESATLQADIYNLKHKVEAGCEFLTTQMFFDNNILYNFMFRMLKSGVNIPVIAGVMPVTNAKSITRICKLSGTALPPRFKAIIDKFGGDNAAMDQAGIAYATEQIIDLIANGITHIHIYTMNKPQTAKRIMDNLSSIFKNPKRRNDP